jgi:hypothetical protein
LQKIMNAGRSTVDKYLLRDSVAAKPEAPNPPISRLASMDRDLLDCWMLLISPQLGIGLRRSSRGIGAAASEPRRGDDAPQARLAPCRAGRLPLAPEQGAAQPHGRVRVSPPARRLGGCRGCSPAADCNVPILPFEHHEVVARFVTIVANVRVRAPWLPSAPSLGMLKCSSRHRASFSRAS